MFTSGLPRVFVSSVVEGFSAYREAARTAITQAGAEPVLVNEDLGSQTTSSRNACLDAVASADIFLLVLGARGGWRAPSGHLVVEEELEEARRRGLIVLVFLEDVDQDEDARELSKRLSDYVDGYFRRRFHGPAQLADEIARALPPSLQHLQLPRMNPEALSLLFQHAYSVREETVLRFVLAPERQEEVIDPIRLASEEFADRLFELGHSRAIGLFNYQHAKEFPAISKESLILEQPAGAWRGGIQAVRMEVREDGTIAIDSNVTGRTERANSSDMTGLFVIAIEDIELALAKNFRLSRAIFTDIDPHKRHQRYFWNASLSHLGSRNFERNPQPAKSFTLNSSRRKDSVMAFSTARLIDRITLDQPAGEIERAIHSWTRKQGRED